tara:strand:+ start:1147 stop:1752 length:606 start_codon:yes stop_codon:yes gene_type:complete
MPALWSTFIPVVGGYLNKAVEKTEEETAEKIASEYHKAVATAMTSLHANMVMVQAPYAPIKVAILKTLNDIKNSEGKPKMNHFVNWANVTSAYWLSAVMNPLPFHPANMAASTGTAGIPIPITHIINNGGVIPALQADLLMAFSDGPQKIPYGIPFATKLVLAFTNHLSTVGGLQTEFVTSGVPLYPVPLGPIPAPWVGMI